MSRAPKSFVKALFINMPLREALKRMFTSKSVPKELKPQEYERSPGWTKPPIPCIPEKDPNQDTTTECTMKVRASSKMQLTIMVFHQ